MKQNIFVPGANVKVTATSAIRTEAETATARTTRNLLAATRRKTRRLPATKCRSVQGASVPVCMSVILGRKRRVIFLNTSSPILKQNFSGGLHSCILCRTQNSILHDRQDLTFQFLLTTPSPVNFVCLLSTSVFRMRGQLHGETDRQTPVLPPDVSGPGLLLRPGDADELPLDAGAAAQGQNRLLRRAAQVPERRHPHHS